ncbi:hypothetical protein HGA88_05175 [Candidatus Roizmanbacteria bacterium]|nr:hypothetical protein [Candidatus Roizmanbacteria bacterium]
MSYILRYPENPILQPDPTHPWEDEAVFNSSVTKADDRYYMVYRAQSHQQEREGVNLQLSTIGLAEGPDTVHFSNRQQFIIPEYPWERFGCEDPRVTSLEGTHYIFYTALSTFPFSADGIRVGVALTKDFKTITEKHPVTPFNSKAMALFPERINGKLTAILTVHTDMPPAKIAIAQFDEPRQMWSREYWEDWYDGLDSHVIPLLRSAEDHLEVGTQPVKTKEGWLILYSYIRNYRESSRVFSIEAVLLDLENPLKVLGRTKDPFLVPEMEYELHGLIPDIVFPSGALVEDDELILYYGASDTTCCVAHGKVQDILDHLYTDRYMCLFNNNRPEFQRFEGNPIISPIIEHSWESKYTFNPAAVYEKGNVHIVYRAMGDDDTSVMGYAKSSDGFTIDERLSDPIYIPREDFETKIHPGFSGCEDPRITRIDDTYYMLYTAYDGVHIPKVAITSIAVEDFLSKRWLWSKPKIITPPDEEDKDACLFPEKINGKYAVLHRLAPSIWIDFVEDLEFQKPVRGSVLIEPRPNWWDNIKIGINSPPIKTKEGWILFYHGISQIDLEYRLGVVLLDLENPAIVKKRLDEPILEPRELYENNGYRPGTVFPCGAVVIEEEIYLYYGAADQYVAVATISVEKILQALG